MTARRAMLVACSGYDDPSVRRLRTPVHDVAGIGKVLADPAIGGFTVTTLIDESEVVVRRTLGRFLRQAIRTDLLVIFFACHGFKDVDGQLYLAARDTELTDVPSTALPADLLRRLMDQSPSRRTVLVLDCCFSGALTRGLAPRGVDEVEVGELLAGQGEGRVIISASRATEYAYERATAPVALRENPLHSVFAQAFIDGLKTGAADLDGDGAVSVTELYDYIHQHVVASTSAQTPGIWNQMHGKLFIAHRPPADPADAPTHRGPTHPAPTHAAPTRSATGPRSPFDADVLDWAFGAVVGVQRAVMPASADDRQAWRAANNLDWARARELFEHAVRADASSPAAWWGAALCHAVDERWQAAGVAFARAADLTRVDRPEIFAGAALLSAVSLRAAGSARWYESIEDALDRLPTCPEVLAYRGIHADDPTALSLAVQLAPELTDDFRAVGVTLDAQVAVALTEAEQRMALLLRTQAAVDALGRRIAAILPDGQRGAPVRAPTRARAGAVAARLHASSLLIGEARAGLADEFSRLHAAAQELLDNAPTVATMALVAAVRETTASVVAALQETDRPAPVRAFGIPPRRQRRA